MRSSRGQWKRFLLGLPCGGRRQRDNRSRDPIPSTPLTSIDPNPTRDKAKEANRARARLSSIVNHTTRVCAVQESNLQPND